jgi:hypothetical protein
MNESCIVVGVLCLCNLWTGLSSTRDDEKKGVFDFPGTIYTLRIGLMFYQF